MNPPIEIIIVGGAAIMMRHNFRMMTNDIDALCPMNGAIQDAFKQVRDKYNLPDDWFNTDFTKTKSYSKILDFIVNIIENLIMENYLYD